MGLILIGFGEIFMYIVQVLFDVEKIIGIYYDVIVLCEIQDWIIKFQLVQVKGVVEVNSIGGYNKQYYIIFDI